jgi:hypothetical protein
VQLEHERRERDYRHSLPNVGRDDRGRRIRLRIHDKTERELAIGTPSSSASRSEGLTPAAFGLLAMPIQPDPEHSTRQKLEQSP